MKYILKKYEFKSPPLNDGVKTKFFISVVTQIEGDKYGFEKIDLTFFEFQKTLSQNQIDALALQTATDFVASTYPNT